jgi:hypothetical protein
LNIGKAPKPKPAEVKKKVQSKLKSKGISFISIDISEGESQPVFSVAQPGIDTATNSSVSHPVADALEKKKPAEVIIDKRIPGLEKFNWLRGTWKVKNVQNETHHYWMKVNDSSLKCFIIEITEDEKTNMTVGFTIRVSKDRTMMLSLKGAQWKFITSTADEFIFYNDLEQDPNVKWTLKDGKNIWQSVRSGEGNAEFINLIKEENNKFEKMVKNFGKQHPDIYN